MNKYLLSVDPSMKNTGFTLWEKSYSDKQLQIWKPIFIYSYCFNKRKENALSITNHIIDIIDKTRLITYKDLDLIIERGIFNPKFGKGKKTLDHLRGFIAGQFNKSITKDMLISPSEWKKWYEHYDRPIFWLRPWDKELSIYVAEEIIKENKWNIKVNNHDEAESLLIGWYYLNQEKNNEN